MNEHDLKLTIGTDKAVFSMASVSNSPVIDVRPLPQYQLISSAAADSVPTATGRVRPLPPSVPRAEDRAADEQGRDQDQGAARQAHDLHPHRGASSSLIARRSRPHELTRPHSVSQEDLQKQLEASGASKRGPGAKTRLKIQRDHAIAAGDQAEIDRVTKELAALDAPTGAEQDRARMINERNRANNREEVRRAEAKAQDFRRKQAELLARGDTDVRVDPSARVKTMPRLNYDSRCVPLSLSHSPAFAPRAAC